MQTERLVSITQEDIEKGIQRDCSRCPGAIAIMRAFPEVHHLSVGPKVIAYIRSAEELRSMTDNVAVTPEGLTHFISLFDHQNRHSMPAKPIEFNLTLDV